MTSRIPFPGSLFLDYAPPSAAPTTERMVPWLTGEGYWIALPIGTAGPAGSVQGAEVLTSGGFLTTRTGMTGVNITRNPGRHLLFYGGPTALDLPLVRYLAGDYLGDATFSRASVASYTAFVSDTLVRYVAGGDLTTATFTRASTATYTASV